MNNIEREILDNQRVILHALSIFLTPKCKGSLLDKLGETRCNIDLIDRMHITEKLLQEESDE